MPWFEPKLTGSVATDSGMPLVVLEPQNGKNRCEQNDFHVFPEHLGSPDFFECPASPGIRDFRIFRVPMIFSRCAVFLDFQISIKKQLFSVAAKRLYLYLVCRYLCVHVYRYTNCPAGNLRHRAWHCRLLAANPHEDEAQNRRSWMPEWTKKR